MKTSNLLIIPSIIIFFSCNSGNNQVEENPLVLEKEGEKVEIFIKNPKHVQMSHVENMKKHLFEENFSHPSNGQTAVHTSWVMDQILNHRP